MPLEDNGGCHSWMQHKIVRPAIYAARRLLGGWVGSGGLVGSWASRTPPDRGMCVPALRAKVDLSKGNRGVTSACVAARWDGMPRPQKLIGASHTSVCF